MVTVERQGVAEGRPSTQNRLRMAEYPQETIKKTDQIRIASSLIALAWAA
jgi:hypothetical protein